MHLCNNCAAGADNTKVTQENLCETCKVSRGLVDQNTPHDIAHNMTMLFGFAVTARFTQQQIEQFEEWSRA